MGIWFGQFSSVTWALPIHVWASRGSSLDSEIWGFSKLDLQLITSKYFRFCPRIFKYRRPIETEIDGQFQTKPGTELVSKLCFETKMTKVFSKILLIKSSRNNFIFLPVICLMYFMKSSKNFGKKAILKTWELISLGGVKTYFGKVALKWCIFSNEKNIITDIVSLLLIQSGFRHTKHLKMTIWISFLWKIYI